MCKCAMLVCGETDQFEEVGKSVSSKWEALKQLRLICIFNRSISPTHMQREKNSKAYILHFFLLASIRISNVIRSCRKKSCAQIGRKKKEHFISFMFILVFDSTGELVKWLSIVTNRNNRNIQYTTGFDKFHNWILSGADNDQPYQQFWHLHFESEATR